MYVFKNIKKKRIAIVCLLVLMSVAIFNFDNSKRMLKENTIAANATPITNKVVILDAGHRLAG